MTITHTLTKLLELQTAIEANPARTDTEKIERAGLEGLRTDLVNELYTAVVAPDPAVAALQRTAVQDFARQVVVQIGDAKGRARSYHSIAALAKAAGIVTDVAGEWR